MRQRNRAIIGTIIIGIISLLSFANVKNVSAYVDSNSIMEKWVMTQFYQCFKYNQNRSPINRKTDSTMVSNDVISGNDSGFALPSYKYGHSVGSDKINCSKFFKGTSGLSKSIIDYSNNLTDVKWSDLSGAKTFLTTLGYTVNDSSDEGEFNINIKVDQCGLIAYRKPPLPTCDGYVPSFDKATPSSSTVIKYKKKNGKYEYELKGNTSNALVGFEYNKNDKTKIDIYSECKVEIDTMGGRCKSALSVDDKSQPQRITVALNPNDPNITMDAIKSALRNTSWVRSESASLKNVTSFIYFDYGNIINSSTGSVFAYPKINNTNNSNTIKTAVKNMTGKDLSKFIFSNAEYYTLYVYYLDQVLPKHAPNRMTCNPSDKENLIEVKLKDTDGQIKKCYVNFNASTKAGNEKEAKGRIVYTQKASNGIPVIVSINMLEAINKINSIDNADLINVAPLGASTNGQEANQEGTESAKETCENSGGAMSLGWIVCPIMKWLGEAADQAYTGFVEPSLKVEPKIFNGGDEGVYRAWEIFRNFANVMFIILLLVVIFSQLTGVGIDNYGIKKILPKLILAAVLINLSYIICLILVDLSNILGNGLRLLFDGLITSTPAITIENSDVAGRETGATILTGIAIAGILVMMVGAIWKNPAILLSLFVGLLGVAISIFFLFVLLSMRQAALIVLIAASPLAFACYMLPNTKKAFDKWSSFFKGLLIVYPVAGLLIGAGNFVSKLLLTAGFASGGFVQAFTAMVVGIAPIFFIPSVIKGSFSAMGKVGAMLSGLGNNVKGRATGRVRNSEAFKNAQRMGMERSIRKKAGYNEKTDGLTWSGRRKARFAQSKLGKLVGADRRQSAYLASAKKASGESEAAASSLIAAGSAAAIAEFAKNHPDIKDPKTAFFQEQFNNASGDIREMNSVIGAAKQSGMKSKDIAKMIRTAENNGNFTSMDGAAKTNWLNSLVANQSDVMDTDFELKTWAQNGGNGSLGDYGSYASTKAIGMDDIKPEDVLKMSGDSLAGMIASGKLTQGMAKRVMAMNPNITEDKKIMLGALADGAATGNTYNKDGEVSNGGTIGGDSGAFKSDASKLMQDHGASADTIPGASREKVDNWTRNTPQEVKVVDGSTQSQPSAGVNLGSTSESATSNNELKIDHSTSSTSGGGGTEFNVREYNQRAQEQMRENWREQSGLKKSEQDRMHDAWRETQPGLEDIDLTGGRNK